MNDYLDPYGGLRALRGEATGFFHTEQIGDRWWLVTPEGHAYWSLGMDVLMLLEHWAPEHVAYCQQRYGSEEAFARHNVARCRALGFNSLGFWTTPTVRAEARGQGMPYFLDLQVANSGPGGAWAPRDAQGEPMRAYWNGPNQLAHLVDPFHPSWRAHVAERCAALGPDDPYLIGYFVDNEIWVMGVGVPEMTRYFYSEHCYAAFQEWLRERYPSIEALNRTWTGDGRYHTYAYRAFQQVKNDPPAIRSPDDPVKADLRAFERRFLEEIVRVPLEAIRRRDPHHLVCGLRFAGRYMAEHLDVFAAYDVNTINIYPQPYDETLSERFIALPEELSRGTRTPVIVTEFSWKADDAGLPNDLGAGCRVRTQADRARGYAAALACLTAQPWCVGAHYFSWQDSIASERSNYGVANSRDELYEPLATVMARVNPRLYSMARRATEAGGMGSALAANLAELDALGIAHVPVATGAPSSPAR
jgi:Beta-galactosidase